MSVFTRVEKHELSVFLQDYAVGTLQTLTGIPTGIENTNYFVQTDRGEYVLTIFETVDPHELPFFLDLTAFLAEHEVPCAHPVRSLKGDYVGALHGKPAALVQRLYGSSVLDPDVVHCRAIGQALATLHVAAQGFLVQRENPRGPRWWRQTADELAPHLDAADLAYLREELRFQGLYRLADLPRGIIHADLFRDNALFADHTLTGVIDFYYACHDTLAYDLAITVNDWCSRTDGSLDFARAAALTTAYQARRPMTAMERGAWPALLRAAALRFWLSRLRDWHFPRPGELTHTKDPLVFRRILDARRRETAALRGLWSGGS
ncbi:MAG: homoserine kinase [Gammaproteobacteria bacterium]|nr:homoserine kinase [Gammaproteobacteria bacterium]